MNKDANFWNKASEKYSRMPISDIAAYDHKLAKTREFFDENTTALEIGCGTGSTALLHGPYVKHYTATDFSSEMIRIANEKLRTSDADNITFKNQEIEDVTVDEPIDVVLALNVLHLVEGLDETISKVNNWLKPNGTFVTSTVCLGDGMKYFKLIAPIGRLFGFMPLLKVFTKSQLKKRLEKNGFRVIYEWQPEKKRISSVFFIAEKTEG